MASEPPQSLSLLEGTLKELGQDWQAFQEAKLLVEARVREAQESGWRLGEWAGTDAVLGSLLLAIEHIERRREHYADLVARVHSGEIANADQPARPTLSVVPGGRSE